MKQGYLEYKESGYEWLGEIPLHWELKKAKWSFKEKSIKGYPDELLLSVSKGKGVIPRGELENKTVMAFKDLQNFKLVLPEDFVIHLRSFQSGFEMSMNKGIVSPAYTVFSCKNGLLPSYYKFLFYMQNFIDAIASTTQSLRDGKPIAYRDFSNMVLPFPKYNEQVKIANFLKVKLKEVDNLIYTKKKLILLLEQQRQSIITEAVTKGLNPNVKMKDSGVEWIGDIPEHWKFTRLDFISRVKARLGWKGLKAEEYVEDGYAFLATPNLKERNIDFKNVNYITEERYLESPEIMLEVGDVLLAKDGSTLGIVNVVRSLPKNATVNSSIAVIRPTGKIDSVYFYYYLKSTYIQDVINQIKDGMGVPHLFQADIKKFKILLPPMDEQVVIAKYLDEETLILEQLVGKVKKQIEKLKEYRQSLIYEAVTGKIDVRDMELDEVR
ncbi:restriction endonuclease subunit S [Bacillus altitudinis]|uniref:restriction endonuclease subunit S n=1 Tax=Bacillus altitudinis TaxID=293387 RepID=UPI0019329A12|nr:restriction endonuclease subunit S [Bacillus altitudinis]QRF82908.1 restriction endonuclease subunit S [Bacillus altitudinis]